MVVFHVQFIMVKFCQTEFGQTPVCVPMKNLNDGIGDPPFDSSVGRAEDCRLIIAVILRSLVQLRLEGDVFHLYVVSVGRIFKAMVFRHMVHLLGLKKALPRQVVNT